MYWYVCLASVNFDICLCIVISSSALRMCCTHPLANYSQNVQYSVCYDHSLLRLLACIYVYHSLVCHTYIHTYVQASTYVVYACTYIRMYVYVCTYVCMCMLIYKIRYVTRKTYLFPQTRRIGFPKVAARQYADARAAMRGSPARYSADRLRGNARTFRGSIQCGRGPGMNAQAYALD